MCIGKLFVKKYLSVTPSMRHTVDDFARASAIFDFMCYADDSTPFSTLNKITNAQNTNPDIIIKTELAKNNEFAL